MEGDAHIDPQIAEGGGSDADSAYESDESSITTTLRSSAMNYVYEASIEVGMNLHVLTMLNQNGRRYQQLDNNSYIFPNDQQEQDRLDMLHHIYRLVQGGRLQTAPISDPRRVLDLGTGTGLWALEFADEFPAATVLGVDLSPIQSQWTAPNCSFVLDDLEKEWAYPPNRRFDYIHQRSLSGSIGNWTAMYEQALNSLEPGGWFEVQEFEVWFYSQNPGGLPDDSAISRWQKLIDQGSVALGRRLNYASRFGHHLEEAGFVDIRTQIIKTPIGLWPRDRKLREIGAFLRAQMMDAVEAVTLGYLTRALGWSHEEIQVMLTNVRKEFNDKRKLLYTNCWFITARKPGPGGKPPWDS